MVADMVTAAIWLAWAGPVSMAADDNSPSRLAVVWRLSGLVMWTAAAILATIAVNS